MSIPTHQSTAIPQLMTQRGLLWTPLLVRIAALVAVMVLAHLP